MWFKVSLSVMSQTLSETTLAIERWAEVQVVRLTAVDSETVVDFVSRILPAQCAGQTARHTVECEVTQN